MRKRIIGNMEKVLEKIRNHFLWELEPFFPEIDFSSLRRRKKIICPFHQERTPSFWYTPDNGTFSCFGCGKSGSLIDFYSTLKGISFFKAVIDLSGFFNIKLEWKNMRV